MRRGDPGRHAWLETGMETWMDETTRVKRWKKMRIKKRNPAGSRSACPCAALPSGGHGRPLDEAGLQALRAHAHLEGGAVACIDPNALEIDQPTTTRVSIRMADGVPCHRAASATLTNFCHGSSPPFFFTRTRMRLSSPAPRDCSHFCLRILSYFLQN